MSDFTMLFSDAGAVIVGLLVGWVVYTCLKGLKTQLHVSWIAVFAGFALVVMPSVDRSGPEQVGCLTAMLTMTLLLLRAQKFGRSGTSPHDVLAHMWARIAATFVLIAMFFPGLAGVLVGMAHFVAPVFVVPAIVALWWPYGGKKYTRKSLDWLNSQLADVTTRPVPRLRSYLASLLSRLAD
jgi:hypothetical protein